MHWKFHSKPDTINNFGFVYLITNKKTKKAYIGCKQYFVNRNGKKVESNWRSYTGSSKYLNEDIKKLGKKNFVDIYHYFFLVETLMNKAKKGSAKCTALIVSYTVAKVIGNKISTMHKSKKEIGLDYHSH